MYGILRHQKGTEAQSIFVPTTSNETQAPLLGTKRKEKGGSSITGVHLHSRFMIDQGTDINIHKRTSLVFFLYSIIPYTEIVQSHFIAFFSFSTSTTVYALPFIEIKTNHEISCSDV